MKTGMGLTTPATADVLMRAVRSFAESASSHRRRLRGVAEMLLLLLLALVSMPARGASEGDFEFEIVGSTGAQITRYTGPGGDVVIPDRIGGVPVTEIGNSAFYGKISLTSVTIPETVNVVRNVSFAGCTGLTSVVIPNSVTHLGVLAFSGCTHLGSVTIGNGVSSIGDNAFSNCTRLASVVIPGSVTSFGSYVFADCTSLANAAIPADVTNNLESAFLRCMSLTQIEVDENNPVYSSVEGVLFDKAQSMLIVFPRGKAGPFVVPEGVTDLRWDAFTGCTKLTSVTVGSGVTTIPRSAFSGCTSLAQIAVNENNPVYRSLDGVLFYKAPSMLIVFPEGKAGPFVVPDGVSRIQSYAFSGCKSLTSLVLPESLRAIEGFAFSGCTSLNGVFFRGDAPWFLSGFTAFDTASPVVLYYLPGTTGWDSMVDGRPTAMWGPQVQTGDFSFGVRSNRFGFSVTWASGRTVVVEAATNLADSQWSPVLTNTLTSGSYYFSDPEWTNHPARFYRVMSQ